MGTYSFLDVQASLAGPGGNVTIGNGSGASEEGLTVEMLEDKDSMAIGADGKVMHSLRAGQGGRITIRLLKTSPTNAQLSQLYNLQKSSSLLWGQNAITVNDVARGDIATGSEMAFTKAPTVVYSKDGAMNEWGFQGNVQYQLGTGIPDNNV